MVQALALTIRNILQQNWALGPPLQWPPVHNLPTSPNEGVEISSTMPVDVRQRIMITLETREPEFTVRTISDTYWQYDATVEAKVWTRAQTFNRNSIDNARADKNNILAEIQRIIHSNANNIVLEDDGVTHVVSWMWVERGSSRDDIDKAPGTDFPSITSTLKIHVMYLRQAGFEPVSADILPPGWDTGARTWDDTTTVWWQ